jgi:hypothetical protein
MHDLPAAATSPFLPSHRLPSPNHHVPSPGYDAAAPSTADKLALVLNGTAPADLEKFLTAAQASYAAGKKAPYTAKLTLRGYAPAAIDGELAGLKGVANLARARDIAAGAALKATTSRDTTAKALAAWVGEFRKVAKRTLRTRPDLLAKLGL